MKNLQERIRGIYRRLDHSEALRLTLAALVLAEMSLAVYKVHHREDVRETPWERSNYVEYLDENRVNLRYNK